MFGAFKLSVPSTFAHPPPPPLFPHPNLAHCITLHLHPLCPSISTHPPTPTNPSDHRACHHPITKSLRGFLTTCSLFRLLEVFKFLRAIVAVPGDAESQDDLLKNAKRVVHDIYTDHVDAAETFIVDADLREVLKTDIHKDCQLLNEYLDASRRFNLEINSRAKDRVVSFGEKLSCRFMASLLKDRVSLVYHSQMKFFFFFSVN